MSSSSIDRHRVRPPHHRQYPAPGYTDLTDHLRRRRVGVPGRRMSSTATQSRWRTVRCPATSDPRHRLGTGAPLDAQPSTVPRGAQRLATRGRPSRSGGFKQQILNTSAPPSAALAARRRTGPRPTRSTTWAPRARQPRHPSPSRDSRTPQSSPATQPRRVDGAPSATRIPLLVTRPPQGRSWLESSVAGPARVGRRTYGRTPATSTYEVQAQRPPSAHSTSLPNGISSIQMRAAARRRAQPGLSARHGQHHRRRRLLEQHQALLTRSPRSRPGRARRRRRRRMSCSPA